MKKNINNKTLIFEKMKKTDVLVIGGSAAGMVSALTGKSSWPKKIFTLVKKQRR
jgi:NADH oxidase (H2O2-forming)